jgi:hypothetical protein
MYNIKLSINKRAIEFIAFLRQVRYIFRAETTTGQGLTVPHQSRNAIAELRAKLQIL